jgi:type I restriction enzyme, S subunit
MELLKGKYKKTEIGYIPCDWNIISFGEIFDFKNGLNKEKKYFGFGTPIVNYMDVYKKRGLKSDDLKGKVSLSKEEIKNYNVQKGDVLFTRTSETVDEVGISSVILEDLENTVFSGFVLRGRPKNDKLNDEFKKYCFSSANIRKEITSKSSYTTRALTNGRLLSSVKLAIPSTKEEQTKIGKALSDIDELIFGLGKLIAKKRNIKQGAMQELFTGKKRLDGFSNKWISKPLTYVCWFQEGPGLRNWQFTKSGMKVINVTNLENGYLNLERTERHIAIEEFDRMYKHFAIDEYDIVVASSGNSYGKVAVVRKHDLPLVMNTSVIRFKPLKVIDYNFLLTFLKSYLFKNQIDLLITGGAQPNFGPVHLKKTIINMPSSIKEQKAIAQILKDIDSELEALENKLKKYKMLKQGMMQNLLTGKIRLIDNG